MRTRVGVGGGGSDETNFVGKSLDRFINDREKNIPMIYNLLFSFNDILDVDKRCYQL